MSYLPNGPLFKRPSKGFLCIKGFLSAQKIFQRVSLYDRPFKGLLCTEYLAKIPVQKTFRRSSPYRRPSQGLLCTKDLFKITSDYLRNAFSLQTFFQRSSLYKKPLIEKFTHIFSLQKTFQRKLTCQGSSSLQNNLQKAYYLCRRFSKSFFVKEGVPKVLYL